MYILIKGLYSFIYLFIYYTHICISLSRSYIGHHICISLLKFYTDTDNSTDIFHEKDPLPRPGKMNNLELTSSPVTWIYQ